jgi:hypothetical protein
MNSNSKVPPSIYIGGACCGVSYFIGVVRAMKETWGEDFQNNTLLCGDSIGSIIALQLTLGLSADQIESVSRTIISNMEKVPLKLNGQSEFLNQYIDNLIETSKKTLYKDIEGRFRCGTTKAFFTHQWHKSWTDNEDLKKCLKGSYNLPFYCDLCEEINGEEVVDGAYGFTGAQFPHGDDTLFIGANQPSAEINYDLTYEEMLIPNIRAFDILLDKGYCSFKQWNGEFKKKVEVRKPNYGPLMLLWIGKFLQKMYYYVCIE